MRSTKVCLSSVNILLFPRIRSVLYLANKDAAVTFPVIISRISYILVNRKFTEAFRATFLDPERFQVFQEQKECAEFWPAFTASCYTQVYCLVAFSSLGGDRDLNYVNCRVEKDVVQYLYLVREMVDF